MKNIEISTTEYNERENRLNALNEKLADIQKDYDKKVKANEVIETSINDSKKIFQKLKLELETQEKEIRDKESRIHRLEALSLIYRASKFFGGILICVGILFLILAFGYIFELIDLGSSFDRVAIIILSIIGASLTIVSGVFHLEKS